MTREEATQIMSTWLVSSKGAKGQRGYIEGWFDEEDAEAFRMAIEALTEPNYETDTEVRLAVTNRKKEKVILWDAFGEVEYVPIEAPSQVRCNDCKWNDDVIEVVRCKDCDNFDYAFNYCNFLDAGVEGEDFFCSNGERKEK